MSDTPRTDATQAKWKGEIRIEEEIWEFARGLERETAELRDNPEAVKLRALLREAVQLLDYARPNWRANQSRSDFNEFKDRALGVLGE